MIRIKNKSRILKPLVLLIVMGLSKKEFGMKKHANSNLVITMRRINGLKQGTLILIWVLMLTWKLNTW